MRSISRRRFIEESIFLSAALAATTNDLWLPKSVRAHENAAPNEKLGVAVVGCGGRSGAHISEFLADARVRIVCVSDPDIARAKQAADNIEKKAGYRPKVYVDMREAINDSSVDIVTCATCNHWHALCGVWAMQAGKHAYIEKPICHNIHEGKALIAAAKKYGVMCQVGSQCRSNPAIRDAFAFAQNGGIGEINLTRGLCYKRRKSIGPYGKYNIPKSLDYNLWSGPAQLVDPPTRPNFHYDWHWQRMYGNGDLGNQGPHQTDIARTFLGVTEFPSSVISYGGRLGYQAERKDDSYVDAGDTANTEVSIYNYADGKTLVFETRGLETKDYRGAMIGVVAYGTEGYLVQVNYGLCIAYDLNGKVIKEFKGGSDRYHFDNFITAVVNNDYASLLADAHCGHLSAGLSHVGNISYYLGENNKVSIDEAKKQIASLPGNDDNLDTFNRTIEHLQANGVDLKKYPISMGRALKIDPKTDSFIGDPEASAMETRDYRGEFLVPDADKI